MSIFWHPMSRFYDRMVTPIGWHKAQLRIISGVSGCVLEVFCGTAALSCHLLDRGIDTYGIDLSPAMVQRAQDRLKHNGHDPHHMLIADAMRLPFPDARFDYVLSTGGLGLLSRERKQAALQEMARVCKGEIRLLEPFERAEGFHMGHVLTYMVDGMKPIPRKMFEEVDLRYRVEWHTILGIFFYIRAWSCEDS